MLPKRFLTGLTVCLAFATAGAARAESLADALAYGYEHSGLLEQNRALLRAADEDVAIAFAALLPIINWSATAQTNNPRPLGTDLIQSSAQVTAELTIYDGGANRLGIEAQREVVLATRSQLLQIEQQVLLRIVQAYVNVRRNEEFVSLRRNNVTVINRQLSAARDRFDVGEVTRTDVSLAEARLASARSLLSAAEGDLAQAQAEYVAAVGRAPGSALQPVPAVPIAQSAEQARTLALRSHPALEEAQHQVAAAEINIRRAETAFVPNVTLQGTVRLDDEFDSTQNVGIVAGGPIYQGGRLSSQLRQIMARRDAARGALIVTARQIEQNVTNAYAFLEVARASRDAFERQVAAQRQAFEGIREEATLGARTTLDVLDAEQDFFDARANLVSAQIDETFATYQILSAMGVLTAEDLRLNVQIYDPSAYYDLVSDAPTITSEQGRALDRVLEAIGGN